MTTGSLQPSALAAGDAPAEPHDRVRPTAAVMQSLTMTHRGLLKIKHNPQQLFDVIVLPIVFTVMFSSIFGGAIAGNVVGYLPLLIPGVLVQVCVAASVVTGVQLREDLDRGVFDRFKSLPIARIAPLAGALAVMAAAVDRCTVDGEEVRPQPGGFYGGWITSAVAGPFKGVPRSRFW